MPDHDAEPTQQGPCRGTVKARGYVSILSVGVVLLGLPGSALAAPYLTLREAWGATKAKAERIYRQKVTFGVGNVIGPRTDCRRYSTTVVDCGFDATPRGRLSAPAPGPAATAPPLWWELCVGTVRVRMTRHYKIVSHLTRRPTCRIVRPMG
jgi:hypothetical protein